MGYRGHFPHSLRTGKVFGAGPNMRVGVSLFWCRFEPKRASQTKLVLEKQGRGPFTETCSVRIQVVPWVRRGLFVSE